VKLPSHAGCATKICDSGNTCSSCGTALDSTNVSVVIYRDPHVEAGAQLTGLQPAEIVQVVTRALEISEVQRALAARAQKSAHKARCKHLAESAKQKMAKARGPRHCSCGRCHCVAASSHTLELLLA